MYNDRVKGQQQIGLILILTKFTVTQHNHCRQVQIVITSLKSNIKLPSHHSLMANSTSLNSSLTSFISHLSTRPSPHFPSSQISAYCLKNDCSYERLFNVYSGYYQKFTQQYDNFCEIVLLLFVGLKKNETLIKKGQSVTDVQTLLGKSLQFVEDLITSKMALVAIVARKKSPDLLLKHFIFLKYFINELIVQVMGQEMFSHLMDLIENCNKAAKSKALVPLNFLVESMMINAVLNYLSEESQKKFKEFVLGTVQQKKKVILSKLWNGEKGFEKRLDLSELLYLRLDLQSPQIHQLSIINDGNKVSIDRRSPSFPEPWIVQAFESVPSRNTLSQFKLGTVFEAYQFLFKLEVFASSPFIEELDSFILNDDFLELFSRFLMNEKLGDENRRQRQSPSKVVRNIGEIRKLLDGIDKPYKDIVKQQLEKMILEKEGSSEQDRGGVLKYFQ